MFDIEDKELVDTECCKSIRDCLFSALIMVNRFASDIVYGKPLKKHDIKHAYNLFTGVPLYTFNVYNMVFNPSNIYKKRQSLLRDFKKQVEKSIEINQLYSKENYELDEYYEELDLHTMKRINSREPITNSARSLCVQITALAVVLSAKTSLLMGD